MRLKITNAPGDTPITLQDAKDFLRVDGAQDDRLIRRLIVNATNACEEFANRTFLTTTFGVTFTAACAADYTINIDHSPIQSAAATITLDGAPVTCVQVVEGQRLQITAIPKDATVVVSVIAGYADDPENLPGSISQAVLTLVAHWFESRDLSSMPDGVKKLLQPLKKYVL